MSVAAFNAVPRCRLCTCRLGPDDDHERSLCEDCQERPEARQRRSRPPVPGGLGPRAGRPKARAFTPADKALIRRLHGYLPLDELLRLLNERLEADLGPDATAYTLEHLHTELQHAIDPSHGATWASLRTLLAQARRAGVLVLITPAVIDDFSVVYQLAPAQVMTLKDVISHAQQEAS